MHPNAFLRSLWRAETLDQIFVAMPFHGDRFTDRYETVIRPAIEKEPLGGLSLTAYRVDNSKSGDSILTDIVDGISHSRLFLADVSVVDEGRYTDQQFRNGNVMYEVGVALACRTPSEVLLIRDDKKPFLFDVSSIPHMSLDLSSPANAIPELRGALVERLEETNRVHDARVQIAVRSLTEDEFRVLQVLGQLEPSESRLLMLEAIGMVSIPDERGRSGLLRKGCLRSVARHSEHGGIFYSLTAFGQALLVAASDALPEVLPPEKKDES